MSAESIVFDLETKHLAHEVGGWRHIDKLGLSAAVTLDMETGVADRYVETDADTLIGRLVDAKQVIGFNVLRFDYSVLDPYGLVLDERLAEKTVDILQDIEAVLGFRLALDNVAQATLGVTKSADGIAAVKWYREGKLEQVLDYCEQDVRVTYRLWQFGREHRYIHYRDRSARLQSIPVQW